MSDSTITFLVLAVTVAVFVCKLGLPLLGLFGSVAVLLGPVIWSF